MPLIYNIILLLLDLFIFFVCYMTMTYNIKLHNIILLFLILIKYYLDILIIKVNNVK